MSNISIKFKEIRQLLLKTIEKACTTALSKKENDSKKVDHRSLCDIYFHEITNIMMYNATVIPSETFVMFIDLFKAAA